MKWDDWPCLRIMQFLLTDDAISPETTEDVGGDCQVEPALSSPFSEHISEENTSAHSLATFLQSDDPAMQCCLQHTYTFMEEQRLGPSPSPLEQQTADEGRPPLALWSISPDQLRYREAIPVDPGDLPDEVELAVYPPMTAAIADLPSELKANSIVVYKTSISGEVQREIIQYETDVLSQQQIQERWTDIEAAVLNELQTWAKLKCLSRRPRSQARNILNTRWTFKFQSNQLESGLMTSDRTTTTMTPRRIRASLTVLGFKDSAQGNIDRHAGTHSRCSHRVFVSEAARKGWDICTIKQLHMRSS
jgi:hypothetical protein